MWPFSSMSLDTASFWGTVANWALIFCLVGGVISTFVIVKATDAKEEHWTKLRQESNERIAKLNYETEKLRSHNLAVADIITPRRISIFGTSGGLKNNAALVKTANDKLKSLAGTKVLIVGANDIESQTLLSDIAALLITFSGWNVQSFNNGPALSLKFIEDGVTIYARGPKINEETHLLDLSLSETEKRVLDAAHAVEERLRLSLGTNFFSVHTDPFLRGKFLPDNGKNWPDSLPEDTMLITVGMKPLSALLGEAESKYALPGPSAVTASPNHE